MRLALYLCVLVVVLGAVESKWSPTTCAFNDTKTGLFYDLTPLQNCETDYMIGNFFINFCREVVHGGCGVPNMGCCQTPGFMCGLTTGTSLYSDASGNVFFQYTNGDSCSGNRPRQAIFQLECNKTATTPQIIFLSENPSCNYNFQIISKDSCPKPYATPTPQCPQPSYDHDGFIDIFVVPHSHDDVGWVSTPDAYYQERVKGIIDGYVEELMSDPNKTFIQVEQAFFYRWWTDSATTDTQRQQIQYLLKTNQLEFVIGGWVMPDEATPTYSGMIDALTEGHRFLLETLNVVPTVGWQIDPFGASGFTGTLSSLAGFKAVVLDRISVMSKYTLQMQKSMEMMWQPSASLKQLNQIFTHVLDTNYCGPMLNGFNFDGQGGNVVNPGNVASFADKFVGIAQMKRLYAGTTNVLVQWGCDFAFYDAHSQFANMDKILAYIQQNAEKYNVTVHYRTLSDYFDAVLATTPDKPWPVRSGENNDFFPYNDDLMSWWSGYFTSRPNLKQQIRQSEAISRNIDSMLALVHYLLAPNLLFSNFNALDTLRMALGEAQHHDATTGTETQAVTNEYSQNLAEGSSTAFTVGNSLVSLLVTQRNGHTAPDMKILNGTILQIVDNKFQAVVVYNSLGWTRKSFVRVYVNRNDVIVYDSNKNIVASQVATDLLNPKNSYLYFYTIVPALGYNTYFVTTNTTSPTDIKPTTTQSKHNININNDNNKNDKNQNNNNNNKQSGAGYSITNSLLTVQISPITNRIESITNTRNSTITYPVEHNFLEYDSWTQNNGQNSGAYIFHPNGPATPLSDDSTIQTTLSDGPYVHQILQVFTSSETQQVVAQQVIRIFTSPTGDADLDVENFVEIEHAVGILPGLQAGREFITRFTTDIDTQNQFYHDGNGFEILRRTYDPNVWNPIAGNFYPGVYATHIKDSDSQFSIIMETSHGVSSQSNSQLEVMLHRRLLRDDHRGVGEALNEQTIATPILRLIVDTPDEAQFMSYKQSYFLNFPTTLAATQTDSITSWNNNYGTQYSALLADLPVNVHLLSYKMLSQNTPAPSILLRFIHLYELGQSAVLSQPVTINILELFNNFSVVDCVETTVTSNQQLSTNCTFELGPKQIKTFVLQTTHTNNDLFV